MRVRLAVLCVVGGVAAAAMGLGQGNIARAASPEGADNPPPVSPKIDRAHNIDFLFQALKAAPDDETARLIEGRIWALWLVSGSDTADLLMSRARAAIEQNDADLAIQLLDAIIELKPDYAEAWNRRATLYFEKHDYGRAMSDIAQVLAREPRHFGALSGLGLIMQDIGDDKHALEAYRKAVEVYPRLKGMEEKIKTLKEKVEGRDL
jgi:tetratricopeptide (TPR) repeat protein